MRNMENPFKFGTIVEENYFTDRVEEVAYIEQFMKSANHLVLISVNRGRFCVHFWIKRFGDCWNKLFFKVNKWTGDGSVFI